MYDNLLELTGQFAAAHEELLALQGATLDLNAVKKSISEAEARLTKIQAQCDDTVKAANKRVSDAVEAEARAKSAVEGSKQEADRIIAAAKLEAETAIKNISARYADEHDRLLQKINDARATLADLEAKIKARKADHAAVEASLNALKQRIG